MQESQGIRRYQETDVGSLGPEKLVVAAYETVVRQTERALALAEAGRAAEALHAVGRAQNVLTALRGALDHEAGGDIAANLDSLYGFMFEQNVSFLVGRDPVHLRHNLRVLAPLLDAWRQIPPGTAARERAARGRALGAP